LTILCNIERRRYLNDNETRKYLRRVLL